MPNRSRIHSLEAAAATVLPFPSTSVGLASTHSLAFECRPSGQVSAHSDQLARCPGPLFEDKYLTAEPCNGQVSARSSPLERVLAAKT